MLRLLEQVLLLATTTRVPAHGPGHGGCVDGWGRGRGGGGWVGGGGRGGVGGGGVGDGGRVGGGRVGGGVLIHVGD